MIQLHILILGALSLGFVAFAIPARLIYRRAWSLKKGKRNPNWVYLDYSKDDLPSWWISGAATIVGGALALGFVASLIPFAPKYWVLTETRGAIESISNRFVDGSGDISNSTYTLTLEGDPVPRVVTDSRILGLQVGDVVSLTCSLEWVYGGADRSNCYLRSF